MKQIVNLWYFRGTDSEFAKSKFVLKLIREIDSISNLFSDWSKKKTVNISYSKYWQITGRKTESERVKQILLLCFDNLFHFHEFMPYSQHPQLRVFFVPMAKILPKNEFEI